MVQATLYLLALLTILSDGKVMTRLFSKFRFRSFDLILKRDDLYALLPQVRGNKARKFYSLYHDLSSTSSPSSSERKRKMLSYGGLQSNAMESLSHIAHSTDTRFTYIVRNAPPTWLTKTPVGNYATAVSNGMNIGIQQYDHDPNGVHENGNDNGSYTYDDLISLDKRSDVMNDPTVCFIPQGGAFVEAQQGVNMLMDEIWAYIQHHPHDHDDNKNSNENEKSKKKNWKIIFASGTGTTALFAHRRLQYHLNTNKGSNDSNDSNDEMVIEVVAIPCVHDKQDLLSQMKLLSSFVQGEGAVEGKERGDKGSMPTVLEPSMTRSFAEPCSELLQIHEELTQVSDNNSNSNSDDNGDGDKRVPPPQFDMIYAPRAFEVLSEYLSSDAIDGDTMVMYYMCGGESGNESQFKRYKRAGLV